MKYIEKHLEAKEVLEYEAELEENDLDKSSLSDALVHPSMRGPDVYDVVKSFRSFNGLKERLFADQGGICCYCGCYLRYPTHPQYVVEHVFPKEKDRTLAGEYENLLLSCRPTEEEERERIKRPKREQRYFFHCDKAKKSEVISISPLQRDCQNHFVYDEFGGVDGIDNQSKMVAKDILNLDCEWLRTRREAAIQGEIFDENGDMLPDEELRHRLTTIMDRDENGMHTEFCFVIQKVIERLLSY